MMFMLFCLERKAHALEATAATTPTSSSNIVTIVTIVTIIAFIAIMVISIGIVWHLTLGGIAISIFFRHQCSTVTEEKPSLLCQSDLLL